MSEQTMNEHMHIGSVNYRGAVPENIKEIVGIKAYVCRVTAYGSGGKVKTEIKAQHGGI